MRVSCHRIAWLGFALASFVGAAQNNNQNNNQQYKKKGGNAQAQQTVAPTGGRKARIFTFGFMMGPAGTCSRACLKIPTLSRISSTRIISRS